MYLLRQQKWRYENVFFSNIKTAEAYEESL